MTEPTEPLPPCAWCFLEGPPSWGGCFACGRERATPRLEEWNPAEVKPWTGEEDQGEEEQGEHA